MAPLTYCWLSIRSYQLPNGKFEIYDYWGEGPADAVYTTASGVKHAAKRERSPRIGR